MYQEANLSDLDPQSREKYLVEYLGLELTQQNEVRVTMKEQGKPAALNLLE